MDKMAANSSHNPSAHAHHNPKSVRFDDPLRNSHTRPNRASGNKSHQNDFNPNDPSCYPLTGSAGDHSKHQDGGSGSGEFRKGIPGYTTPDGILV